ncbi:MAG: mechanosensitive ion channel family protein, partial [Lutibacter sp.]|nr:mechanosensitive ion channel family protein [Lutibacter sp.]
MLKDFEITQLTDFISDYLIKQGMIPFWANSINLVVTIAFLGLAVLFLDRILRKAIIISFKLFSLQTKTAFDDFLAQSKFPKYIAQILPIYVLKYSIPYVVGDYPVLMNFFNIVINVYAVVLIVKIIRSFLRSTQKYLRTKERFKDKPLESYTQVIMLFFWGIATIFIVYQLTGKDIMSFATLGAAS